MDGSLRVWDVPSARCLQAMSLAGPPVTSLSLSPAHDLLATTHADCRGIYLWANQAVFGDAADAPLPSDAPVRVGMPTLAVDGDDDVVGSNTMLHSAVLEAADSSDDEGPSSSDDEGGEGPSSDAEPEAGDGARPYEAVVPETGAPAPLAPSLVTLSLLPRSQWQSLVHLEAIQVGSFDDHTARGRRVGCTCAALGPSCRSPPNPSCNSPEVTPGLRGTP